MTLFKLQRLYSINDYGKIMNSEKIKIGIEFFWPLLKHYPSICVKRLKKTTINPSQGSH
jgi:hypothetical protein